MDLLLLLVPFVQHHLLYADCLVLALHVLHNLYAYRKLHIIFAIIGYYKISSYEKSKYMTNARQFEQIGKAVSTKNMSSVSICDH